MRATGIVAAAMCLAACGDPESVPPLGTTSQAIIGGVADSTHASVVSIVAAADASTPELCSGTVIAPRVVLTAGHCTLGQDPAGLVVGVGPSASSPTTTLAVASVVTYPGYSGADDLPAGTDLGVILLAEDAGVPCIALFAGDAAALVGAEVTVVGYGQSSASDLESSGTRRETTSSVSAACSALLSFGDATSNACHGDSGGPLLVVDDAGASSVAAVVSFGDEIDCAKPTRAVRVDRYAAWIAEIVAGSAIADGAACTSCPALAVDCTGDAGAGADTSDAASADEPSTSSASSGGCAATSATRCPVSSWALELAALGLVIRRRNRLAASRS